MKTLSRTGIALALAACIGGCAMQQPIGAPSAVVTSPRAKVIPADRAHHAVTPGKTTKADVLAALGQTLVISFDTGFEIWVYRLAERGGGTIDAWPFARANPDAAELVILFEPSGVVAKSRIRFAARRG